jgi:hypothetical protein
LTLFFNPFFYYFIYLFLISKKVLPIWQTWKRATFTALLKNGPTNARENWAQCC